MNILVVGLGALGTVYSCLLKNKGHRVQALVRESAVQTIKEQGVAIEGIWGAHSAKLDGVVSDPALINNEVFDLILLTVKSFDTESIVEQIKKNVSPRTYVVLLQNGYGNFEAAAGILPKEKLILGRVIFGAETIGTGVSKVTVIADDVIIGSPENLIPIQQLEEFAQIFHEAGIPTRVSDEVMKYIWGKIIYNSALNPLGAIFEVNYGKLVENSYTKSMIEEIVSEIFDLLAVANQKILWPDAKAYLEDFYTKMIPTTAAHHASMLQDIRKGKKTEIDALNGAVVQLGKNYSLKMPVNEFITLIIKAKEQMG